MAKSIAEKAIKRRFVTIKKASKSSNDGNVLKIHLPQHRTGPSVLSAQVWAAPAATAVAVLGPPNATAAGMLEGAPQQLPCPSVAKALLPQHQTEPNLIAHTCELPALAYVTPLAMFETAVATYLSTNVPSPS